MINQESMQVKIQENLNSIMGDCTYIFSDGTAIKIGYCTAPSRLTHRRRALQCGNPREIKLVGGFLSNIELELHHEFSDFRLMGEWFDLIVLSKLIFRKGFLYPKELREAFRKSPNHNPMSFLK